MSEASARLPIAEARTIADALVELLEPYCEQIVVCGSIRRLATTCGDVDLVAIPKTTTETDMFGLAIGGVDLLNAQLNELGGQQVIHQSRRADGTLAGWGPRLKKLVFRGLPVQVQSVEAECLGMWMVIRTGPSTYSHAFVTPRGQKAAIRDRSGGVTAYRDGMLPPGFEIKDGFRLFRYGGFVPTPGERDVYSALGWRYPAPGERK